MTAAILTERPKAGNYRLKSTYLLLVGGSLAVLGSLLILAVGLASGFRARDFSMRYLVAPFARWILGLAGVRVIYQGPSFPRQQHVYISNHTSALDIFAICCLGLPRTRYFMSVSTLKLLPLTVVGLCTGVFYIAEQSEPARRRACFQAADALLRRSGESVYLTPEGIRNPFGPLRPFNKGAFHLATSLKAPLFLLKIDLPAAVNPGLGIAAAGGEVHIRHLGTIPTAGWSLADAAANAAMVRGLFDVGINSDLEPTAPL